jgi:hypothetical protein
MQQPRVREDAVQLPSREMVETVRRNSSPR